jgi:hypothetical protein
VKYVSLIIDNQWTFGPHFRRRLYEGIVRSRILYGSPAWAGDLMTSCRSLQLLRRLHRTTAIRIVRGYRTISHASASVLAASPPFELQALALQQVYDHLWDLGWDDGGTQPTNCDRPVQDVLREVKRRTWERWRSQLLDEDTTRPHRAVRAILPKCEAWRNRGGVSLTYRMTQVLISHGVFGEYLLKIQREVTSICHHYQEEEDTAQHTLERCPAWEEPRRVLRLTIGDRLAPEAVIEAMMRGQQELAAVRYYCKQVTLAKERAEKNREKRSDPIRVAR